MVRDAQRGGDVTDTPADKPAEKPVEPASETDTDDADAPLLKRFGSIVRQEVDNALDERLRVEPPSSGEKDTQQQQQEQQDQENTPGKSLAERLGFGAH
jgi:hypothetical protein